MNTCYIFGAAKGLPAHFSKTRGDFVIAADAGFLWLRERGFSPDLAVGDFDSAGFLPTGCEILRYPVQKDDTDSMLAVKAGFERGYSHFVLFGCYGDRPDHTFSNYQLLTYIANRGGTAVMHCDGFCATVLTAGGIVFSEQARGNFSVFSLVRQSEGVTIQGGLYTLSNGDLPFDSSLGQSNAFVGGQVRVSVSDGALLIFWQGKISDVEKWEIG